MVTLETVKNNKDVRNYILAADKVMESMGFTDHSYAHLNAVMQRVTNILQVIDADERTIELGKIAAYMHDIGICVSRKGHAAHGALMAFRILTDLGMDSVEIAQVIGAIGNHDEDSGYPISHIAAALILADKSDIRRSRVRNPQDKNNDIHDVVNYAVTSTRLSVNHDSKKIVLELEMDECASAFDLFSIYSGRLEMCRIAAKELGCVFNVKINDLLVKGIVSYDSMLDNK